MSATALDFFHAYASLAEEAAKQAHLLPETVLVQWAIETDFGQSHAAQKNNFAGISRNGHVLSFPDKTAFVAAYAKTMGLAWYAAVREADTPEAQMSALGASPWASSHYAEPGGAPGSSLIAVYQQYQSTIRAALNISDQAVHPSEAATQPSEVTVQPGETMSSIAAQEHVSLSALEADNPQIKDPNLITPGEKINVPASSGTSTAFIVASQTQVDKLQAQVDELVQEMSALRADLRAQFPKAGF